MGEIKNEKPKKKIMKKILYLTTVVLGVAIIMASCSRDNNRLASGSAQVMPVPAGEYAQFKDWQQQQLEHKSINTATTTARPVVIHKHYVVNRTTPAPVTAVQPAKKKGWSKAAKGTVIGAGAGAAAGALLVKNNRALGAVIGGVLGGGVGYGVGHSMDKKDGR
jgi:hypothetical protein